MLVRGTSSCLVVHFYKVPSKYFKVYSSYRTDKKFYADADADADTDANGIRPENHMSRPTHFGRGGGGGA